MNSGFVVVKPPEHRLDEGEEVLGPRDMVFHVDCCVGGHDVIDVRLGKRVPEYTGTPGSIPARGREGLLRRHM